MIIKSGDFDLRGYEVVRAQSFASANMTSVSFSKNGIRFSSACIRKFVKTEYIDLQVHPFTHEIAVIPRMEQNKPKMCWARVYADGISVRTMNASAYLKTLYELFGWDMDMRYRLRGEVIQDGKNTIALFDARRPEIFISRYDMEMPWAIGFGDDYYEYRELQNRDEFMGDSYLEYDSDPDLQPTSQEEAGENIQQLIEKLERDGRYSGASTDILY